MQDDITYIETYQFCRFIPNQHVSFGLVRYASVRAIESVSPVDDQQWLTYWVLYSLLTLFELTFSQVIGW